MFTSILWKCGLIGLAVVSSIALALAHGNSRVPKSSPLVDKPLLAGSGAPEPVSSILRRACRDCHSDNTVWPWYADLPPVSWQIRSDVTRGRAFMNLSKWSEYDVEKRRVLVLSILAATQARVMPPPKYLWMHANAKLSDTELKLLKEWALAETEASSQKRAVISH
jgi:hypothetical protein